MSAIKNLLFKVTLSSTVLTAPSGISVTDKDANYEIPNNEVARPYFSSAVIKKFVNYTSLTSSPVFAESKISAGSAKMAAFAAEKRMVITQASILYSYMNLQQSGLDQKAFEYAWRGYHNLLKKGIIRKKSVLSICDFSQPSTSRRMYVIDVRHKKLLYRTYVAHGQNSGCDYAESFSNERDSYKSSLGFYVTSRTYYGRNGLSLKINGVDTGYNDLASKRNIVLHGSSYASPKFVQNYGTLGTSLGCPAIPTSVSPKIIRAVKNGSVFFIYHPTPKYLEESTVINNMTI